MKIAKPPTGTYWEYDGRDWMNLVEEETGETLNYFRADQWWFAFFWDSWITVREVSRKVALKNPMLGEWRVRE